MTIWSIPSAEGDVHTEEITGILVEYTTPRAYWEKPMEPGSISPPDCSSPDGIMGSAVRRGPDGPGGPCHACPLSKFGSDPREDSNGHACKEKRMLFMLRPDSLMPLVVQAPSTSIRNVFDFTVGLANEEVPFQEVFTTLTLEKVNAGGIDYSKVALKSAGPVPEEFHGQVNAYQNKLTGILGTSSVAVMPDEETPSAPADDQIVEGEGQPAAAAAEG